MLRKHQYLQLETSINDLKEKFKEDDFHEEFSSRLAILYLVTNKQDNSELLYFALNKLIHLFLEKHIANYHQLKNLVEKHLLNVMNGPDLFELSCVCLFYCNNKMFTFPVHPFSSMFSVDLPSFVTDLLQDFVTKYADTDLQLITKITKENYAESIKKVSNTLLLLFAKTLPFFMFISVCFYFANDEFADCIVPGISLKINIWTKIFNAMMLGMSMTLLKKFPQDDLMKMTIKKLSGKDSLEETLNSLLKVDEIKQLLSVEFASQRKLQTIEYPYAKAQPFKNRNDNSFSVANLDQGIDATVSMVKKSKSKTILHPSFFARNNNNNVQDKECENLIWRDKGNIIDLNDLVTTQVQGFRNKKTTHPNLINYYLVYDNGFTPSEKCDQFSKIAANGILHPLNNQYKIFSLKNRSNYRVLGTVIATTDDYKELIYLVRYVDHEEQNRILRNPDDLQKSLKDLANDRLKKMKCNYNR